MITSEGKYSHWNQKIDIYILILKIHNSTDFNAESTFFYHFYVFIFRDFVAEDYSHLCSLFDAVATNFY